MRWHVLLAFSPRLLYPANNTFGGLRAAACAAAAASLPSRHTPENARAACDSELDGEAPAAAGRDSGRGRRDGGGLRAWRRPGGEGAVARRREGHRGGPRRQRREGVRRA